MKNSEKKKVGEMEKKNRFSSCSKGKRERLGEALRANLTKRKAQKRNRKMI